MRRVSLTLLIVLISLVTATAQNDPVLIDSFGMTPNGDFRARADVFIQELQSSRYRDSRALIIVYGSPTQVDSRKRLIRHHFSIRPFPNSRLEVKVGGNVSAFRTDLWLIPAGAAMPQLKPEAWIEVEFGRVYRTQAKKKLEDFLLSLIKYSSHTAIVVNYGPPDQVSIRERWLRDQYHNRRYDPSRVTLVNDGSGPVRTVMWLVPPGAENPIP